MLRLVHSQTVLGRILVDDIDDGLPNKQVKRLGSNSDPDTYARDGYANAEKQPCYIPREKPGDATIPGYIDLRETQRVTESAHNGKIKKLQNAGLISVVSLVASDLATPVVSAAAINTPAAGDVTITGTGFLSVSPDITKVVLVGAGVGSLTLTTAQIIATAPGAVGATSIVIDTLVNGALAAGDTVTVIADGRTSNTFTIV